MRLLKEGSRTTRGQNFGEYLHLGRPKMSQRRSQKGSSEQNINLDMTVSQNWGKTLKKKLLQAVSKIAESQLFLRKAHWIL